ncbi:F-box domain-containing protein [Mycena sanguinolenta]|uniref:F-box domain-containing protein n=1 Tax=Mycena sanguinolenta TaxID=230812 RepID=A0A8H6ZJ02_9AGAR|nr:F-box domain-containing protein [Mycena sanguinolenta]
MPFEALGEDVLLRIFCFCDIYTALAVSAINRPLRRIALSKQLWLFLVLDTRFRDALDLPPPDRERLECLSPEELIAVVKNAVAGPGPSSSWDLEHDESSSVTMTCIQIPPDDMGMDRAADARLLPGARYILLHSTSTTQRRLCMYDVWSARRVWDHTVQALTMFHVDLVPGATIARVCLAQPGDLPNTLTVHIEEVELTTGASHELFNFSFGSIGSLCAIVGDFLLGTVLQSHWNFNDLKLVLINWRTCTFVSLGHMGPSPVQLIPGYILSTYQETSPPRGHILAATALEAFSDRWQALTEEGTLLGTQLEAGSVSTITINNIATQERLEYNSWQIRSGYTTAEPDPLYAGAYIISVHGLPFPERPAPRRATLTERIGSLINMTARRVEALPVPVQVLLSYRFMPGQGQGGSKLQLVSARRVSNLPRPEFPRAIPRYSGNTISVVYRQRKGPGADAA